MIIDNQLNRRNITDGQRTYLLGKRYKEEKKENGGDRKSVPQREEVKPTAQKIAEQNKVSHATVERAEKFADVVDIIPDKKYGFIVGSWLSVLGVSSVFVLLILKSS